MTHDPHAAFEAYLAKHDSRYTTQKRAIADEIFFRQGHFEIETFIEELRKDGKTYSRATLYRTLKQLLDANLIQKIATKEGKVFYEQNIGTHQHDHIICNSCGKIMEITEDVIDSYVRSYCEKIKFTPQYRSLHIYGECSDCANA